MLAYLETADYSIREEMVLKVIYIQCMIRTFTDSRKSTFLIFRWPFWLRSTPPTTSGTDMLINHLLILIPIKLIVSNTKPIPKFQSLWQCNLLNCRYVDVILNLIRLAGDYVSEEVGSNPKNLSFGFKIAFLDFELSLQLILDILGLVQSHPDCDQQGRRAGEKDLPWNGILHKCDQSHHRSRL